MTTLYLNSKGPQVRALQELLNKTGAKLTVDGGYGPRTKAAVEDAQRRLGLVVDGIAGPQTMTALKAEAAPVKPKKPEPDKSAMNTQPTSVVIAPASAEPPPNAAKLDLLDTSRKLDEIIWHCTATPEGKNYTVSDIRAWHKQRGWTDIGYHYVVYRDGTIMLGRPVGQIGSHVAGHNTGTIGVSYVGGLTADAKTAKDTRTAKQRSSMLWLRDQLMRKHPGISKNSGHNQYAAKACPSFNVPADSLGKTN